MTPANRKYRFNRYIYRGVPLLNRDPITQVMESRIANLGSYSESHWKYAKMEHGLKFVVM